jgi:hypothetical protein
VLNIDVLAFAMYYMYHQEQDDMREAAVTTTKELASLARQLVGDERKDREQTVSTAFVLLLNSFIHSFGCRLSLLMYAACAM